MASKRKRNSGADPDPPGQKQADASSKISDLPFLTTQAQRAAWVGFVAILLAAITWVVAHTYLVDRVTVRLCAEADKDLPVEKRLPVFLDGIAFDGYTWNRYAETLGENGRWRLRFTDLDNAPTGREVHWNSAFAWYLRGLGEIRKSITGEPLRHAIFRMSIWANPILLLVALCLFAPAAARRFGPLCGSVLAVGMVSVPTFYEGFMPAYPDHHGLIAFSIMGMLFGLAAAGAGWVQGPTGTDFVPPTSMRQARQGMILSAICGAAGLWISALSMAIMLAASGIAAVTAAMVFGNRFRRRNEAVSFVPELWKTWAAWGSAGSLVFYLLEYFPGHLGWRLEVNHPFYALAWWGGGSGVAWLGHWFTTRPESGQNFPWKNMLIPALAASVLPACVLFGDGSVYAPKDPFLWKLHQCIAEFLPLTTRIELGGLTWTTALGWSAVFWVTAMVLLLLPVIRRGTKAALLFLSIPILVITALQFYQTRWGLLAGPVAIATAAIVIPEIWRLVPRTLLHRTVATVVLLGFSYLVVHPGFRNCFTQYTAQYREKNKIPITPQQALALVHRQMARTILDSAGGNPVVLLSSPNSSCMLSGLGGFRSIGTLYWENVEGLKTAAAGLNAQSEEEAFAFIRRHGVTHIALMNWENFVQPYFQILHPKPRPGVRFENSFAKRALFDKVIPPWTRALVYPPNELTRALGENVLLLQFSPGQSFDEARFHLGRFVRFVEGKPAEAENIFRAILRDSPGSSMVRLELADLLLVEKRYQEGFDQAVQASRDADPTFRREILTKLEQRLSQAGAEHLAAKVRAMLR